MGFRYQRRIKLTKKVGLNVSKSGVTPSIRTKYGSISPKRFSLPTGIPGLTYRGKNNGSLFGLIVLSGLIIAAAIFIGWIFKEIYHYILRRKMDISGKIKSP